MSGKPEELSYDQERVIRRLGERVAVLVVENAKLEDVVAGLLEQRNAAAKEAEASATPSPAAG